MIKSHIIHTPKGDRRVIEGYKNYPLLYIHETLKGVYSVSPNSYLRLDTMVEIDNNFRFNSLGDLHKHLNH